MTEYKSLREKIAAESKERKDRYEKFQQIFALAQVRGMRAGEECEPIGMIVSEADALTDRGLPGGKSWHVPEGVCGFAWVNVYPATGSFARWLTKNGHASKAYGGGTQIWIKAFGQSMQRKEACARAMADVFTTHLGVTAYAGSRMD